MSTQAGLRRFEILKMKGFVVSFVLAVNTGHILVLRRKTCALLRAKTSALLRRKTCAVLRARTCALLISDVGSQKCGSVANFEQLCARSVEKYCLFQSF